MIPTLDDILDLIDDAQPITIFDNNGKRIAQALKSELSDDISFHYGFLTVLTIFSYPARRKGIGIIIEELR